MPKIIENLRERLMQEARRQAESVGYSAMTVRSVASACGVGVGTVYNYFDSKEALLAAYMLEDWLGCVETICQTSREADGYEPVARCIYEQLRCFSDRHGKTFRDPEAASHFTTVLGCYHPRIRAHLAQPLRKFCASDFAADFVAESLLTWTINGRTFDELNALIARLF